METLREVVDATAWIDTHEHLLEPGTRLRGAGAHPLQPCMDFALLFAHYAADDLASAGMPADLRARFFAPDVSPEEKWHLLHPWRQRTRHTGYMRAVEETARMLYGIREWNVDACLTMSAEIAAASTRPKHYAAILQRAGVLTCQVNSLEVHPYCRTSEPEQLLQDLSLLPLTTALDLFGLQQQSGIPVRDLASWHDVIDWVFATYGPLAVAVKSQAAYARSLDFQDISAAQAAPLFARLVRDNPLEIQERKALEDHLMRYCIRKAEVAGLPIKLHCGYFAGTGSMPLERVRNNAPDLCPLLDAFGDARFVLMHIGYPYQGEYLALAKHYRNVYVDLCWAWIVSPIATEAFLREFLLAAPANKILCFGGDYATVENVVGHAELARRGLTHTLEGLVQDGWLAQQEALELIPMLMHGNAQELFGLDCAGKVLNGQGAGASDGVRQSTARGEQER